MILLYCLVNNDSGIDFSDLFIISSVTSTRGHMYKLYKPHATTRARCHFFSVRAVNSWNSLPDYVVTAQSLNVFKNQLDDFFSDQMTQIDFYLYCTTFSLKLTFFFVMIRYYRLFYCLLSFYT